VIINLVGLFLPLCKRFYFLTKSKNNLPKVDSFKKIDFPERMIL